MEKTFFNRFYSNKIKQNILSANNEVIVHFDDESERWLFYVHITSLIFNRKFVSRVFNKNYKAQVSPEPIKNGALLCFSFDDLIMKVYSVLNIEDDESNISIWKHRLIHEGYLTEMSNENIENVNAVVRQISSPYLISNSHSENHTTGYIDNVLWQNEINNIINYTNKLDELDALYSQEIYHVVFYRIQERRQDESLLFNTLTREIIRVGYEKFGKYNPKKGDVYKVRIRDKYDLSSGLLSVKTISSVIKVIDKVGEINIGKFIKKYIYCVDYLCFDYNKNQFEDTFEYKLVNFTKSQILEYNHMNGIKKIQIHLGTDYFNFPKMDKDTEMSFVGKWYRGICLVKAGNGRSKNNHDILEWYTDPKINEPNLENDDDFDVVDEYDKSDEDETELDNLLDSISQSYEETYSEDDTELGNLVYDQGQSYEEMYSDDEILDECENYHYDDTWADNGYVNAYDLGTFRTQNEHFSVEQSNEEYSEYCEWEEKERAEQERNEYKKLELFLNKKFPNGFYSSTNIEESVFFTDLSFSKQLIEDIPQCVYYRLCVIQDDISDKSPKGISDNKQIPPLRRPRI